MKSWQRIFGYVVVLAVLAGAYFIGRAGRGDNGADTIATSPPDPGYTARDAEVIETGYDGRERYRLNARAIHQQNVTAAIDVEQLSMDYHPGAQAQVPGEAPAGRAAGEVWHLKSDRGQIRADGDDVELSGNVVVDGQAPGSNEPLSLSTETLRINTPTEFIETKSPVKLLWSGHELNAVGLQADLKAGTLRLESEVHGEFSKN